MTTESHHLQPNWLNAQCPREGRYVLGPLLGRGGMGEVQEAWDVVLCRTVALKVLRNMEPAALIRFMHEAQIQARVVHPNICRIYDMETTRAPCRVAMQLVQRPEPGAGLPGAHRCRRWWPSWPRWPRRCTLAHRLNLIHRDLKPSNILLERDAGGPWIPYVCDFGLAMALDEPALTYHPRRPRHAGLHGPGADPRRPRPASRRPRTCTPWAAPSTSPSPAGPPPPPSAPRHATPATRPSPGTCA